MRRFLFVPLLVLFVLGGAATASAGSAGTAPVPSDIGPAVVTQCNAFGAQRSNVILMNNQGTSIGETSAPVTLTGSVLNFSTPAGTHQVLVTFSAEAGLFGAPPTAVVPADFMLVRIVLDGTVMQPADNLAFTTYVGESAATQVCRQVSGGSHQIRVEWQLVDQAAGNTLTGVLDDWALNIRITAFS